MRAAVVGAGFAGLAAADALRRAGAEVVVLEARDRAGGRVWSQPLAGGVVERGAEFVFEGDAVLRETAARLGLRLVPKGTLYGDREPRGGPPVDPAEHARAVERLRTAAGGTVTEALAALGVADAVAAALAARLEVSSAYPADDLDASVLAEAGAGFGDFPTYGVEGGNARLAEALAAPLGAALRLGAPVEAVAWGERSVRLRAAGAEVEADAAVLAAPAPALLRIAFDPPLPVERAEALAGVRYGHAAKLHVPLRRPSAPSAVLSVPGRYWAYTQLGDDGRPAPFAAAFAGTPAALERLRVAAGPDAWLAALAELRPELDLEAADALLTTWSDDPWALGAYSARSRTSPLRSEELARPLGALAFAGEHTAGAFHGLMEGALRSGLRAAEDVLSR
ncbi:MAG TPA: FAD-dependent oxidoreductase [Gaiellaceae bacterium]|nr:FAD-dependent oxidoreductase [Gaiellaceae bacterium]